ncbi:2-phospho-L-lactate guanylyltransferase [compost metagenome]
MFGANSLQRFRDLAGANGYELHVIHDPNLSVDIDSPEDFNDHLCKRRPGLRPGASTRKVLQHIGTRSKART